MEDLIKALMIFQKYIKPDDLAYQHPIDCDENILCVMVNPNIVTRIDKAILQKLGFFSSSDARKTVGRMAPLCKPGMINGYFMSYRFGSVLWEQR